MKKFIYTLIALCMIITHAWSQCSTPNTTQYPSTAVNAGTGTVVTISTANFEGDYSRITGVVSGYQYKFTISLTSDIITVRVGSYNGTVLGYGTGTGTTVTATSTSDLYVHWNTSSCGTGSTSRTTTVQRLTAVTAPTVTTVAASSVLATSAQLNGTVNPNNGSTTVTFDYGLTTSYGSSITATQSPVSGSTAQSVSAVLSGLTPNTTYHFRCKGVNSAGTTNGSDFSFTTPVAAPVVTTTAATSVTSSGATLNGTVNPGNASTTVTFDYGLTTGYGSSVTASQSPLTGSTVQNVSASISGLTGSTTYHFRTKAVNSAGTVYGSDQTLITLCSGTPAPGNTVITSGTNPTCVSTSFTLGLDNPGTGVTYQWQSSTDGITYGNVSGATISTLTTTETMATYFRCNVTCSGNTGTSTALLINKKLCYCTPPAYTHPCADSYIINVTTTGGFTNFNNTSGCNPSSPITDYSSTISASQYQGSSITMSFNCYIAGYPAQYAVWIDFNDDGTFASGEKVITIPNTNGNTGVQSASFNVLGSYPAGIHRMRVRSEWYNDAGALADPCTGGNAFGETEDYSFIVLSTSQACASTPTPGNTVITSGANPACSGSSFTLGLQNLTMGTGVTYDWQSSDNGSFSGSAPHLVDAIGTGMTLTTSETATNYYRCQVTCSGNTGISNPLQITYISNCYCTPTGSMYDYFISSFSTTGGTTNITNNYSGNNGGYSNCTNMTVTQAQGSPISFSISGNPGTGTAYTYGYAIWVDWNQNGTFESSERMFSTSSLVTNTSGSFTVPSNATPGITRMRVFNDAYNTPPPANPCATYFWGEIEDYSFLVTVPPTAPTATTNAASAITPTGATLNGTVNPDNASTTVTFDYGTSITYGSSITATQSPLVGSFAQNVSATLTGLASNTLYHFRVKALNSVNTAYGSDMTFTTAYAPPAAPVFYNTGSTNQLCFNNSYLSTITPIFRTSATSGTTINSYKIEINTAADFSGTSYTQTFSGTYTSGTQYDLTCNSLSSSLPTTDGVTYYVRAKASVDAGANWSPWSSGTFSFTYKASGNVDWMQTTKAQFLTDAAGGYAQINNDYVNLPASNTLTYQVSQGSDDGFDQSGTGGTPPQVDLTDLYVRAGHADLDANFGNQTAGMRFQNINIPQGTTIASAKLEVRNIWINPPDNNEKGNTNVHWIIGAEYVNNSSTFDATTGGRPSGRTQTTAKVNWDLVDFINDRWYGNNTANSLTDGNWYDSPDITSVVQAVVNRAGWASGNALSIIMTNNAGNSGNYYRTWHAYEAGATYASKLIVTIPVNGTITSSLVDFNSFKNYCGWNNVSWTDDQTAGTIKYQVYYDVSGTPTIIPDAALPGNAAGFTTSPIDISGLSTTTYQKLYLKANLSFITGSPTLYDWKITLKTPSATASSNSPVCAGNTINLTSGGGTSYAWTGPNFTSTSQNPSITNATPAASGNYIVTTTGSAGCTASATTAVSVSVCCSDPTGASVIPDGTTTICSGTTQTFNAGVTGGYSTTLSYQWYNATGAISGETSSSLTTGIAGSYYVIVSSSCQGGVFPSNTVTLAVTPLMSVASVSGDSPLCINGTAVYTANSVVLGGGTGTWSSSDQSIAKVNSSGVVRGMLAGNCSIIYTITGGCGERVSASQPLTILPNANVASVSGTSSLCRGSTAIYSANNPVLSGGTGAWSSSDETVATVDPSSGLVTAVAAGNCNIIYTITGGCGGTASAQQPLTINPDVSIVSVSGTSPICPNTTTLLTANGVTGSNVTISWWSGISGTDYLYVTGPSITEGPGTYYANVSGDCGTAEASITIDAYDLPTASIVNNNGPICSGSTGTFYLTGTPYAQVNYNLNGGGIIVLSDDGSASLSVSNATSDQTLTLISVADDNCSQSLSGSNILTVFPKPTAFNVTGTGSYCPNESGVPIGLDNSEGGVMYVLYDGNGVPVDGHDAPLTGAGSFSFSTPQLEGTYSVSGYYHVECPVTMNGSAVVTQNTLPQITSYSGTISVNNETGLCSAQVTYNDATASGSPAPAITYSQASGSVFNVGPATTVTVTATNTCGVDTKQFDVTVTDNEPPAIIAALPDITGECSATILSAPTAHDNCAGYITGTTTDPLTYTTQGDHNVQWKYDDGNGNITYQTQMVLVHDVTAPVLNCPAVSASIPTDHGLCNALVTIDPIIINENCSLNSVTNDGQGDGNYNASGIYEVGPHTVTWTVEDVGQNIRQCSISFTVYDGQSPWFTTCPGPVIICNENDTYNDVYAVDDNCTKPPFVSIDKPPFTIGDNYVTYTVTDANNNISVCTQKVTLSPPITASISQSNLPGFCQGEYVLLTATASGSSAVSYLWSPGGATTQTIQATSGIYTVTVTNTWGCTSTATKTVNVASNNLISAYTILVNKEVEFSLDKVFSGGVGAKDTHGEVEAYHSTDITAAGTFAEAHGIYKDYSSQITTMHNNTPVTVAWPAFQSMPYHAPYNSSISVGSGHSVTLSDTLYREIKVGRNATVTFTKPVVNIETSLRLDDGATVKFSGCAKVRIKGDLWTGSNVSINPAELSVVFYIGGYATFGGGNYVNGVYYCHINSNPYTEKCGIYYPETRIYIYDSRSTRPGIFKGLFIADEMYVHSYNNFYLSTHCNYCTATKELAEDAVPNEQINEAVVKNYPNPFNGKTTLLFILPEDNKVKLDVYDISGKLVQTLYNGAVNSNQEYKVEFDGSALPSGIYIYKMTTNDQVYTGKMIMSKE